MKLLKSLPFILIAAYSSFSCDQVEESVKKTIEKQEDCIKSSSISGAVIPDQYIIATKIASSNNRGESIKSMLSRRGIRDAAIIKTFNGEKEYHLVKISAQQASEIKTKESVLVEPDRKISACGCFTVVEPKSITWNVEQVGYEDGTGKTAWIVDTGIDSDHPDLIVDKVRSKDFTEKNSFEDDNGHGTHIAGIVGAINNQVGVLGVASGANIVALKVLDENGDGKLSYLLNALTYIKSNAKAGDVVNISISFPEESTILENEIKSIASKGIYFTLAAGNDSDHANNYSPGRTAGPNIYTVSAVDSLRSFASFSNFGNDVIDFAAPGVRILSTYKDGKYAYLSGTSMAAPHVAGILLINNGKVNTGGYAADDPDGNADPIAHY